MGILLGCKITTELNAVTQLRHAYNGLTVMTRACHCDQHSLTVPSHDIYIHYASTTLIQSNRNEFSCIDHKMVPRGRQNMSLKH